MRIKSFRIVPNTLITIGKAKLLVKDFTRYTTLIQCKGGKLTITDSLQEILPGVQASYKPENGRFYAGTLTLLLQDDINLEVKDVSSQHGFR